MNKQFLHELEVRRLPLARVHVDSGPLTASAYASWVWHSARMAALHPNSKVAGMAVGASAAFEAYAGAQEGSPPPENGTGPWLFHVKELLSFLATGSNRA